MNFRTKFTKKFVLKNFLLQNDLDEFLTWRHQEKRNSRSVFNKTTHYHYLTKKATQKMNCTGLNEFSLKNTKNPYKPIQINFFKNTKFQNLIATNVVQENSEYNKFLVLKFFSANKPFIKFWFFPLIGVAFFTLINSNEKTLLQANDLEKASNLRAALIVENADNFKQGISKIAVKKTARGLAKNTNFIPISPLNLSSSVASNTLQGTYYLKNSKTGLQFKTNSLDEIQEMCSFYLKTTTTKLDLFSQKLLQSENSRNILVDNILFQSQRWRKTKFDLIWYFLKRDNQTLINNPACQHKIYFSQKLKTPEWSLEPKKLENFFESDTRKITNRPNLEYIEASRLLDHWVKKNNIEVTQTTKVSPGRASPERASSGDEVRASASDSATSDFPSQAIIEQNLNYLTDFVVPNQNSISEDFKNGKLVSHLFSLFELSRQNRANLKKLDVPLNSNISLVNKSKDLLVHDFKKTCIKKYNKDFFKLWFKHYLQKQNLKFETQINPEKKLVFITRSNAKFSIQKLFKKTIFYNNLQNVEQRKLFVTLLKMHFLKMNLLKMKKTDPQFNLRLELNNQKLYSKTYELVLLNNWKLILKDLYEINFEKAFDGLNNQQKLTRPANLSPAVAWQMPQRGSQFSPAGEALSSSFARRTRASLTTSVAQPSVRAALIREALTAQVNDQLSREARSPATKFQQNNNLNKFFYELKLYRKFSKLSSRIFALQKKFSKNSNKKPSNFIFLYKYPILQGIIQKESLENDLSGLTLKSKFTSSQKKEFQVLNKQLVIKPQLHLKQSLVSNKNNQSLFIDLKKRSTSSGELIRSKDKNVLFGFSKQFLTQFRSFSKTIDESFLKNSYNNELLNLKQKEHFVYKHFKLQNGKTYVVNKLKPLDKKTIKINNQGFQKKIKQKIKLTINFSNSLIERRKIEKIFRTYNSIKSQNQSQTFQVLNKSEKAHYGISEALAKPEFWRSPADLGATDVVSEARVHRKLRARALLDVQTSLRGGRVSNASRSENLQPRQNLELSSFQAIVRTLKQLIRQKQTFNDRKSKMFTYQKLNKTLSVIKLSTEKKSHSSILNLKNQNPAFLQKDQIEIQVKKKLSSSKLSKKLIRLTFLKKAEFLDNPLELSRFEAQKRLEKKRRLKKLKLENRRRKKRKRFYPRPPALRFQLYFSFIKSRYHSPYKLNFLSKSIKPDLQIRNNPNFQKTLLSCSFKQKFNPKIKQEPGIEKSSIRKRNFNDKIYRRDKQNWGNITNNIGEKTSIQQVILGLNQYNYHESEFYKISNDILADFEKLCWKSYWLRSNIKPYIHRVQENLQKIQVFERLKNNKMVLNLLLNQSTRSISHSNTKLLGFFNKRLNKTICFPEVSFYPNAKATLETGLKDFSSINFFKILEKKNEYDKLIHERIRDQIKNVKSQLNVNGENQARSYKTGRQKFEIGSNPNLFSAVWNFRKILFDPTVNNLPFFSLSNDNLIKPFGDIPTLRILWACHHTNLLTYDDNNFAKTLWSTYKRREQLKSNKTRKFLLKILNLYRNWNTSTKLYNNLKTSSQTKTNLISQKTQLFLGPVNGEIYSSYKAKLRGIKFQLDKKFIENNPQFKQTSPSWFETPLQTKLQKSVQHFWWSKNQNNFIETGFPVFLLTPSSFVDLNEYLFLRNSFSFKSMADVRASPGLASADFWLSPALSFARAQSLFKPYDWNFNQTFIFTTFWFSCILFHLSLLFALIRIPEIRNLLKFQFLVFSKLSNTYLTGVFSIYKLLITYKNKLICFVEQSIFSFKELILPYKKFSDLALFQQYKEPINFAQVSVEKNFQSRQKTFQTNLDLNLVTKFRCRLFFQVIETHLVKTKEEKLEPFVNFSKEKSYLFFRTRFAQDSFYQHFTKQQSNIFFIQDKNFTKSKNNIYSFFTGWQWSIDKSESTLTLTQTKNKSLNRFTTNSEKWIRNFLQPKNYNFNSSDPNGIKEKQTNQIVKQFKNEFNSIKMDFSFWKNSTIQFQSLLSLIILYVTKTLIQLFYFSFVVFYKLLFSIIDCLESFLLVFYKFFEKPAELMVTWIADFFLVEWSSDLVNYVPDALDRDAWISFLKFSRSSRFIIPIPFSFFFQRILLMSNEIFFRWLLKPDSDLITRQKKGIIFWDIWSEILILAAEQYKMNLSSLSTIKEEQELLIENLIRDKVVSDESSEKSRSNLEGLKNIFSSTVHNKVMKRSNFKKPKAFGRINELTFFTSQRRTESFQKLEPLLTFLKTHPSNPSNWLDNLVIDAKKGFRAPIKSSNFPLFDQFYNIDLSILNSELPIKVRTAFLGTNLKNRNDFKEVDQKLSDSITFQPSERWSVNQALTVQGRDTDLFIDIHPPKSFLHVGFLKNYLVPQEILGSLVCDIYSGQFPMKISKNILIVGPPGRTKSFFIQALAGETESKIVIDNAHRYTFINGGVPIGMKLLREVFDSIALYTPCLFLLEDIHLIGERRPMLISDDESSKSKTETFGAEQEEVHEKDRSIYQLSRHALSHYNRPYKGDFSLSIPTNHFCYDLFLGMSATKKRVYDVTAQTPLSLKTIDQNLSAHQKTDESSFYSDLSTEHVQRSDSLVSFLQLSIDQVFAPPVTSPFNILLLKEQKKLKSKKIVKEMPWSGLSHDQSILISKTSYSIRAKVATLAELSITNLSMKLDMITDLLVIIDSVRSNRGFVVFATTHLPALLDPALRRPGRLDETLSLPILSNLLNRFEIFKLRISFQNEPFDFFDYSLLNSSTNENQLEALLSKSMLLLLNTKGTLKKQLMSSFYSNFVNDYSIYSLSQAFRSVLAPNSAFINAFRSIRLLDCKSKKFRLNQDFRSDLSTSNHPSLLFSSNEKLPYLSLTYSKAGRFLIEALLLHNHSIYAMQFFQSSKVIEKFGLEGLTFQTLYSSEFERKNIFIKLFAGKISEFFVFNDSSHLSFKKSKQKLFIKKPLLNPSEGGLFDTVTNSDNYWKSALDFLDSFFQKRYLYNKNLIVSKLLFFEDSNFLRQTPTSPNSSILMPAKKFENYKRMLRDFIQKPMFTINEKIQSHQQQRFLKLLYKVPFETSFKTISSSISTGKSSSRTQLSNLEKTTFYSSFKELGYLDLITLKPSSSSAFYKNRFLIRHRFSFLNQWWNGQLAEHNIETTYLSHVDWRSMFIPSIGDLIIDFPDAEQYYNPRSRRWFLQSSSWSYWFDFEQQYRTSIYEHYIYQAFVKISGFLDNNRELLDYLAFRFLREHQLKEIDLIYVLLRFQKQ